MCGPDTVFSPCWMVNGVAVVPRWWVPHGGGGAVYFSRFPIGAGPYSTETSRDGDGC
jgi:hypothetical protein